MGAARAGREVAYPNRSYLVQLRRMPPHVGEPLLPEITAWQGELDARIHIAIGRDVAGDVSGAACRAIQGLGVHRGRHPAKALADDRAVLEEADTLRLRHPQAHDR